MKTGFCSSGLRRLPLGQGEICTSIHINSLSFLLLYSEYSMFNISLENDDQMLEIMSLGQPYVGKRDNTTDRHKYSIACPALDVQVAGWTDMQAHRQAHGNMKAGYTYSCRQKHPDTYRESDALRPGRYVGRERTHGHRIM